MSLPFSVILSSTFLSNRPWHLLHVNFIVFVMLPRIAKHRLCTQFSYFVHFVEFLPTPFLHTEHRYLQACPQEFFHSCGKPWSCLCSLSDLCLLMLSSIDNIEISPPSNHLQVVSSKLHKGVPSRHFHGYLFSPHRSPSQTEENLVPIVDVL